MAMAKRAAWPAPVEEQVDGLPVDSDLVLSDTVLRPVEPRRLIVSMGKEQHVMPRPGLCCQTMQKRVRFQVSGRPVMVLTSVLKQVDPPGSLNKENNNNNNNK